MVRLLHANRGLMNQIKLSCVVKLHVTESGDTQLIHHENNVR